MLSIAIFPTYPHSPFIITINTFYFERICNFCCCDWLWLPMYDWFGTIYYGADDVMSYLQISESLHTTTMGSMM